MHVTYISIYWWFLKFSLIFDSQELQVIQHNLAIMQNDIHWQYQQAIDELHHGYPAIVETIHTGSHGRPSICIDPEFLWWSYFLRSIKSISLFLGVSWRTVHQQLLENGIAQPGEQPFVISSRNSQTGSTHSDNEPEDNDLLDPSATASGRTDDVISHTPSPGPASDEALALYITSYTAPQSNITDGELDDLVLRLCHHFCWAGISMLDGMLRRLVYRIPRERIRQLLIQVDPVHWIFQRICIRRRVYSVPGPNSLWHHDGQHGIQHEASLKNSVLIINIIIKVSSAGA